MSPVGQQTSKKAGACPTGCRVCEENNPHLPHVPLDSLTVDPPSFPLQLHYELQVFLQTFRPQTLEQLLQVLSSALAGHQQHVVGVHHDEVLDTEQGDQA